jgi:hypothetical protein
MHQPWKWGQSRLIETQTGVKLKISTDNNNRSSVPQTKIA